MLVFSRLFYIFVILLIYSNQVAAAWFFSKKPYSLPNYIKEEVFIDRLFQSRDGVHDFKIAILIPDGLDFVTVTITYDQYQEKKINNLAWVIGASKVTQFTNFFKKYSDKKPVYERVFPYEKHEEIKEYLEYETGSEDLPQVDKSNAEGYEKIIENRYIVQQRYIFRKNEVFKYKKKRINLLEMYFDDGSIKAIDIKDDLYRDSKLKPEEKFLPTPWAKPYDGYAPKPVLGDDDIKKANRKYNDYLKKQNEVIKKRQEQKFIENQKILEMYYGQGNLPDYDGLYVDN